MKRLVVITGASRGIGSGISVEANNKFNKDTVFLLVARDEKKLNEIKDQLVKVSPENKFITLKFDFAKKITINENAELLKNALAEIDFSKLEEVYVIYNHGTLVTGKIETVIEEINREEFLQINVFGIWVLLTAFMKLFPLSQFKKQYHINVSSDSARFPSEGLSLYCTSRAAREMVFKSLAVEHPGIRTLNYWPGAVYTDMLKQVYDANVFVTDAFKPDYEQGKYVTIQQSAERLIDIILKDEFQNGAVVDYYTGPGIFYETLTDE